MLSSSDLGHEIVEKAKSLGASIAGIAGVASLKNSPSHKIYPKMGLTLNENFDDSKANINLKDVSWPEDAVSVVVLGVEHGADQPELDWWDGTGTPGNRILMKINQQLSEWIEKTFHIKTYKLPYFFEKGGIFLKDAAVQAGLGCLGKNNLVITPEYGPRIRFRALFLTREAKSAGCSQFNPCQSCGQPCRSACPVKAFQNTIYTPKISGQSFLPGTDGTYDRAACNLKMEKDIDEAAGMMAAKDGNQKEIRQLIDKFERSHIELPNVDQTFSYCVRYCRICELSCPAGNG